MMVTGRAVDATGILPYFKRNKELLAVLVAQTFVIVGWAIHVEVSARLDERDLVNYKEELGFRLVQDETKMREIDEKGSRSIPVIERRLNEHEQRFEVQLKKIEYLYTQIGLVPPIIQVQIDQVKDQQRRIIEALDNTYNILQQHLRDPNVRIEQIPLKK